jgi:tetratricopeptide (TPR) repeat protein
MRAETSEAIGVFAAYDAIPPAPPVANAPGVVEIAPPGPDPAPPSRRFDLTVLPGITRAEQIAATLDRAMADDRFRDFIARADAARDSGDWITATREYGEALRLFPLHWGYSVQYAHTVKEQGLYGQAEAWYRSAVALGAPAAMVDQHLAFVAHRNGVTFARRGLPDLGVPPMQAPPTVPDIRLLVELTRVPGFADEALELDMLRTLPDNRAVLLQMLAMPAFARTNRVLLDIVRG